MVNISVLVIYLIVRHMFGGVQIYLKWITGVLLVAVVILVMLHDSITAAFFGSEIIFLLTISLVEGIVQRLVDEKVIK